MLAREFERETHRIDQRIWDAMALRAGESVLFCGFANNLDWIKRAAAVGVDVSVIASDEIGTIELRDVKINVLRGSTSMIPAKDETFDATVAFHYLHEIDPFFHANVVIELGRVGKRCIIVEPAPPGDPLGLRIASLYSRAKRDLGQFENYHHIEYWRKLISIVKSEVAYQTFTFTRTPPREAIRETIALIIATMAAEDTPETYLAELRALARRPDAQLLPQARYVITGTAVGAVINTSAGTRYREHDDADLATNAGALPLSGLPLPVSGAPAAGSAPKVATVYSHPERPELPEVVPVAPLPPSQVARNAFGLPAHGAEGRPSVPSVAHDDADDFGVPSSAAEAAADFGWEWEKGP